jgi:protein-L-isoaspartate(D-aspartate) O-methyltransferase
MFVSRVLWLLYFSLLCLAGCAPGNPPAPEAAPEGVRTQHKGAKAHEYENARRQMVERQIRARGVEDQAVLEAMRRVPRHRFVPEEIAHRAYEDNALPIGHGQTISQPYIVAYMTQAAGVSKKGKVLEIGTGSGYQAAVLGELARAVYSIEIIPPLAERARRTLAEMGYGNVHVRAGNGYLGWPEHAPFDAIVVTAAPEEVPPALVEQLAVGGKMVVPVGTGEQDMMILTKTKEGVLQKKTIPVRFVPMTGKPTENKGEGRG